MLQSFRYFGESDVTVQRMKITKFYEKHGEEATKEAFGADRKIISKWRKRLKESGGRLEALVPCSTRPLRTRKSGIPPEMIKFIKDLREAHPRSGKEKIKPLLDGYCTEKGWKTISESTIGNVIKKHHLFSYPRCPKINACIERYNRTIQEEFIDNHLDIIGDPISSMRPLRITSSSTIRNGCTNPCTILPLLITSSERGYCRKCA